MAARNPQATPRILGLTGPIACGKSTVGSMLLQLGALARIDADEVVHELMRPGTETTRRIEYAFGPEVISPDRSVDRKTLGERVFSNAEPLHDLEEIVHPAVDSAIRTRLERFAGVRGIVVLDAVKLLQTDLAELCSAIWVVRCSSGEELRRLMANRGMTQSEAEKRIASQPDFVDPRVSAVIDNSGTLDDTCAEVAMRWRAFVTGDAQ